MQRYIDIEGAHNIRDLGDYHTQNGGRIKWRKIFRAGLLSNIEAKESDKMKVLNLQSICDFRTLAEQEASPDYWYNLDQLKRFPLPIGEGRLDKLDWMKSLRIKEGKESYLYKANRSYVLKETHRYKAFFEILLEERNYPLLYHCTAGKDRTGFATVLLLSALGVDRKTIIADYLLTNLYMEAFAKKNLEHIAQKSDIDREIIKTIFQAKETYLQGALDAIAEKYGTIESYLQKALAIGAKEIQQLKKILVEY